MQKIFPNTILYAAIVGPGRYILSFVMAWLLAQLTKGPRTILAVTFYLPSMTAGVTISTVWAVLFSGDRTGYLNSLLLQLGIIQTPITWLQSPETLMPVMILVALWSSFDVGFLSMLSGICLLYTSDWGNGWADLYYFLLWDGLTLAEEVWEDVDFVRMEAENDARLNAYGTLEGSAENPSGTGITVGGGVDVKSMPTYADVAANGLSSSASYVEYTVCLLYTSRCV